MENQCRWHRPNEKEALGGAVVLDGGEGGAATVSGQKSEKRENTQEKGGNLVPAVPHLPPHTPTLHFIYRAQMGWDQ